MAEFQLLRCKIALGGERGSILVRHRHTPVSFPELMILQFLHGDDAVFDVYDVGHLEIASDALLQQLRERYKQQDIEKVFPGRRPRLPLADGAIPECREVIHPIVPSVSRRWAQAIRQDPRLALQEAQDLVRNAVERSPGAVRTFMPDSAAADQGSVVLDNDPSEPLTGFEGDEMRVQELEPDSPELPNADDRTHYVTQRTKHTPKHRAANLPDVARRGDFSGT